MFITSPSLRQAIISFFLIISLKHVVVSSKKSISNKSIDELAPPPKEKAKIPLMTPKPPAPKITHKVYFKVSIDERSEDEGGGIIVFGLFGQVAPYAVENFRALCTGEKGISKLTGKPLHYQGSVFHRIIPNFMLQGGDITHGNGVGGESIYGTYFDDEIPSSTTKLRFDKRHYLAMANKGRKNTNGSQFFINTVKTTWLDNKYVIFGAVLEGHMVVKNLERLGTNGGKPRARAIIMESGELGLTEDKFEEYFEEDDETEEE